MAQNIAQHGRIFYHMSKDEIKMDEKLKQMKG
jgi:hypothetical protein